MKRRLLRAGKYGGTINPSGVTTAPGFGFAAGGGVRVFQASIDEESDETGKSICLVLACTPQGAEPFNSDSIVRARVSWGGADGGGSAIVDCRQGARVNLEAAQTVSVDIQIIGTPGLIPPGGYQIQVAILEGSIALGRPNTYSENPYLQGGANPPRVLPVPPFAKALAVLPDQAPGADTFTLRFWRSEFDLGGGARNCGEVNGIGSIPVNLPSPVPNVATFYSLSTSGVGVVQFSPVFELQI